MYREKRLFSNKCYLEFEETSRILRNFLLFHLSINEPIINLDNKLLAYVVHTLNFCPNQSKESNVPKLKAYCYMFFAQVAIAFEENITMRFFW